MFRIAIALCLAVAVFSNAAEPEPSIKLTDEQRREVVERYKKHIEKEANSEYRLGRIERLKQEIKGITGKSIIEAKNAEIKNLENFQQIILEKPAQLGPTITGQIIKGSCGQFAFSVQFQKIIDKASAVVSVFAVGGSSVDVLLDGIDTSRFSDDTKTNFPLTWYCVGNKKVNSKTIFHMVPVTLTTDEIAELKAFKPVIAKKK